jgi:trehalose utilization protein
MVEEVAFGFFCNFVTKTPTCSSSKAVRGDMMYYLGNEADINVTDGVVIVLFCKLWARMILTVSFTCHFSELFPLSMGIGAPRARVNTTFKLEAWSLKIMTPTSQN